jgi:hypothetical protein
MSTVWQRTMVSREILERVWNFDLVKQFSVTLYSYTNVIDPLNRIHSYGIIFIEEKRKGQRTMSTAQELLNELHEKHFPPANNMGEDDVIRLEEQLEEGVINPIILARILGIRPQAVYGAIRDGKIAVLPKNDTQKYRIQTEEAVRWASQYLTRKEGRLELAERLRQAS